MQLFLSKAKGRFDESFVRAAPRSLAEYRDYANERFQAKDEHYSQVYQAADDAQTLTQNATNAAERKRRAYKNRIEAVKEATGVELEDPSDVGRYATLKELQARLPGEGIYDTRKRLFQERLVDLEEQFPDKADQIRSDYAMDEEAAQIGRDVVAQQEQLDRNGDGSLSEGVIGFLGSSKGYLRDPFQAGTMFVGGPTGQAAKTVGGRILYSVLANAGINAGVEAALQPLAQAGRAEAGLQSGFAEGAEHVAFAAALGGVFGGVFGGGAEIFRAMRNSSPAVRRAAQRATSGDPQPGDLDELAEAAGVDVEAADSRAFDAAMEAADDERAAFDGAPAGVAPNEQGRLADDALRSAVGEGEPVAGSVLAPERAPDLDQVLLEVKGTPKQGAVRLADKPVSFEQMDPATLATDAAAYQYKGGGDAEGVTDRLRDVKTWDPTASGKIFVHERANGQRFVADGHQRLGLAKRLQSDGAEGVALDGYVYRETDGWTVQDVRALAAKKNMQEGSGTPIDAARILRDRPDLLDGSLPVSGPMMRKAIGLARLSDDAWGQVVNGVVAENHASLVGELVADPALHSSVLQDVAMFKPETDRQARLLIGESLASGRTVELQNDMFGSFQMERTLMAERVKVLDAALKALKSDSKLFGVLADNADIIEAAGNQLDSLGNKAKAVNAEMITELLDRMARSRGPVSDALTEAARVVADGGKPGKPAREFVSQVRDMIEQGGLSRLLDPPQPELKPATSVEPGSPEAAKVAEDLEPSLAELEEARQGSMWDMLPDGLDEDGNARFTRVDDLDARADRDELAADLVASCKD
ncbi:hypothetical protein [Pseudovibrio sp. POLY-S9]|uniref:hypothetical protein n=1 Tax=Pseudovibrio sp. POLY-S9 TaxID=1576596 RepID=UPI00070EAED6|nr:hypothetical protein [Pseudovibrio sp. POLY-S9]